MTGFAFSEEDASCIFGEASGCRIMSWHDLRHVAASALIAEGAASVREPRPRPREPGHHPWRLCTCLRSRGTSRPDPRTDGGGFRRSAVGQAEATHYEAIYDSAIEGRSSSVELLKSRMRRYPGRPWRAVGGVRLTLSDCAIRAREVADDFPKNEIQVARPIQTEDFAVPKPRAVIQITQEVPSQRLWLISEDDAVLYQVQSDFLAFNWRQRDGGRDYPRYEALRGGIERGLRIVEGMVADSGGITPTWCEVSYINQVPPLAQDPAARPPLHRILRNVGDGEVASLPPPEDRQVVERFRIEESGQPIGRVIVSATPGYHRGRGADLRDCPDS